MLPTELGIFLSASETHTFMCMCIVTGKDGLDKIVTEHLNYSAMLIVSTDLQRSKSSMCRWRLGVA
jgi:hypothetical protein